MYTRPWMVIAVPLGVSLIGFIFDTYGVVSMFWIFQYFATFIFAPWLAIANLMYTGYITQTKIPTVEKIFSHHTGAVVGETSPPPSDGFIPLARKPVNTVPVMNQQVVSLPRFDKERNFAVTLIRMYEYDPETVDMTEAKWVKTKKFVREEFKAMLETWEGYGVIVRKSKAKNAPYCVDSWAAVRLIANGNPLPPLPR